MNKTKLVWGIICLVLAVVLGVLYFVLPPDQFVFMLGDTNAAYIPAIALGIVGIVLVATAGGGMESETTAAVKETRVEKVVDKEKVDLNKRLESIAWGCFLIMLGGFSLVPDSIISKGYWSIGIGVIMLGLNAARYFLKIKMSGFTTFLGLVSLASGILQLFGWKDLEAATLLFVLGAYLIVKPWIEKRKLFGKAEEG